MNILQSVKQFFRESHLESRKLSNSKWNFRSMGLVFSGIVLVMVGVLYWRRRRRSDKEKGSEASGAKELQAIELYRSLERVLSEKGLARPSSLPPLSHAKALRAAGHPVGEEACRLTMIYVRVRYGRASLSEVELRDFKESVKRLRRSEARELSAA